jgi:hypothetical protein
MNNIIINSKTIAIKQVLAFIIDFTIIVLPLIFFQNMMGSYISGFIWYVYIPFSEYYFNQTLGMKILGTKIYGSAKGKISKLTFGAVARRQISRIAFLWSFVGWIFVFFGEQLGDDYVVVYNDKEYSTDITNHPNISQLGYRWSFATTSKVFYIIGCAEIVVTLILIVY